MTESLPDIIPVQDANQLAGVVTQWHELIKQRLQHMVSIPEGTELEFENGDSLVLEASTLSAFQLGIQYALSEMESFPINVEYEDDEANSSSGTRSESKELGHS